VIPAAAGAGWRRFVYSLLQLVLGLAVLPVLGSVAVGSIALVPQATAVVGPTVDLVGSPQFYLWVTGSTFVMFVFGILGALATMVIGPRLLSAFLRPGRTYPLYGIRWIIAQAVIAMSNSAFFIRLFGDSSAAVGYLMSLGYRMPDLEQTGSNIGTELRQDSNLLTSVGSGTMISDGLVIMNADFSATSFRLSPISIGARNFIGNNIVLPADAKIGDNVLLGTKVMVPIDGPLRENVGLLGSPCFEIPRSTTQDHEVPDYRKNDPAEFRRRLRRKFWHNLRTMLVFLAVRWIVALAGTLAFVTAVDLYYRFGAYGLAAAAVATALFGILFTVLVDRAVLGFRSLVPRLVSIYDPYFWLHERTWKLGAGVALAGTPFRNVIHRMLGVRVGRRVFDDGCYIPERTLVSIGDDAVLNTSSVIQCHSLEDGTFKSDRSDIGAGAVIGVAAFVHYGVTIGEGSVLEADAFLMKGETVAPFAIWRGNPAAEVRVVTTPVVPEPAAMNVNAAERVQPAIAATVPLSPVQLPPAPQALMQQAPDRAPAQPISSVYAVPLAPVASARPAQPVPPARPAAGWSAVHLDPAVTGAPTPAARLRPVSPHARPVVQDTEPTTAAGTVPPEATTARPVAAPAAARVPAPAVQPTGVPRPAQPRTPRPVPPHAGTYLPGPRSAELLGHREPNQSTTGTRQHLPFAVTQAGGSYLWDADGNMFIDFLAGAGTVSPEQRDVATHGPAMRRDDVLSNIAARGEQIAGRLAGLANHPAVREVRGAGLMWEIELNACRDGRSAAELADDVRSRALHGRLIVDLGGRDDCVVRMLPPLNVTAELVDIAMSILLHAIEGAYVRVLKAG
jgi:acetyltransferase-like isoleucine patch superfamily enzyme